MLGHPGRRPLPSHLLVVKPGIPPCTLKQGWAAWPAARAHRAVLTSEVRLQKTLQVLSRWWSAHHPGPQLWGMPAPRLHSRTEQRVARKRGPLPAAGTVDAGAEAPPTCLQEASRCARTEPRQSHPRCPCPPAPRHRGGGGGRGQCRFTLLSWGCHAAGGDDHEQGPNRRDRGREDGTQHGQM